MNEDRAAFYDELLEQTYLKKTQFVSYGKVKGCADLCQKMQHADENMAPKPVVMKNIDVNGEKCVLLLDTTLT